MATMGSEWTRSFEVDVELDLLLIEYVREYK
jgi:hypothetical protein